jgi:hypothetical protein
MDKSNVVGFEGREANADPLTEMLRAGAQQLIRQAVEVELQELLEQQSERRTADGKAGVVRNGYLLLYPTLDRATFFILCRLGREEFSRIIGHVERT